MKKNLRNAATAALICAALPLAACTTPEPGPDSTGASGSTSEGAGSSGPTATQGAEDSSGAAADQASPSSSPETPAAETAAQEQLEKLTLEQRVGQVLMMGVPATGASASDLGILQKNHVGNVFLKGRSTVGVKGTAAAVKQIKATVSKKSTGDVGQFISTDQEGGKVQVLKGPGFSTIPNADTQGRWTSGKLKDSAEKWGTELKKAGVTVNLAPVADTVPTEIGAKNAPIGAFNRDYGKDPASVEQGSMDFSHGMKAAGVAPVIKHFPGLGLVSRNTDVSSGVTDATIQRDSGYMTPFLAGIRDGNEWVMLSSAYYSKLDPKNPAPFSSKIINTVLREDNEFDGIVISDDMCDAKQFEKWTYATRAKKFFEAGGTMMLCVNQGAIGHITEGLVAEAKADPAFKARIDEAALLVLTVKDGL